MLKAVIFDLNGTILADEDEYKLSFLKVLENFNVKVGKGFSHIKGIGVKANWDIFKRIYKLKTSLSSEELSDLTQNEYLSLLPRVKVRKGFIDLVFYLKKLGIRTALASSNNYPVVEKIIDQFNLFHFFDAITTAEEVSLNKPSPQIFLLTAEKLGVEPHECLVFEDSSAGVEAAISAGMAVVGIAKNEKDRRELLKAHKIISGFSEFDLAPIAGRELVN